MARSYSVKEGVAVGGKFVGLVKRTAFDIDREQILAKALKRRDRLIEIYSKQTDEELADTYHKTRDGWIKSVIEEYERTVKSVNTPREFYVIGKEGGSKERIEQLEQIRQNSAVKEVIYRGQDAYEILDSKKAAEIVKKQNDEMRSYDKHKDTSMWARGGQGSRGDGLYHMTSDPVYASVFGGGISGDGSGVVEGVIDSRHLLNLRGFKDDIQNWYAGHPNVSAEKERFEKQYVSEFRPNLDSNANKAFAGALVDSIAKQYQESFGKPLPEKAGVRKYDKENSYDVFDKGEPYKDLKDAVYQQLKARDSLGTIYMVMKMPFFKKLLKDTKFDTVSYFDYGNSPSYALTSPNQFKSYYGNKPVDKKSPNMFDAGPA